MCFTTSTRLMHIVSMFISLLLMQVSLSVMLFQLAVELHFGVHCFI